MLWVCRLQYNAGLYITTAITVYVLVPYPVRHINQKL